MYFTFKWKINEEDMNTLIEKWNNGIKFNFRCRYSISKTSNNEFTWRGWTDKIKFLINTPPEKPTNLHVDIR